MQVERKDREQSQVWAFGHYLTTIVTRYKNWPVCYNPSLLPTVTSLA